MRFINNKLYIFISLTLILLTNSKLLFVNIHFRHGARGPIFLIDKEGNDLLGIKWKKRGILTAKGKRQSFLNGIKHREKYSNFLKEEYIEDEIKAYSTDSYRAISSLECYLNGLYYNTNLNENIMTDEYTVYPPGNITENLKNKVSELGIYAIPKNTQIIPINIFQKSEHSFVLHERGEISDCQTIEKIREKMFSQNKKDKIIEEDYNKKYSEKFKNFFKANNFTVNFDSISEEINLICDTIYSDINDYRDLTNLEKEGINIEEINNFCYNILSNFQKEIVSGNKDIVMMSQTPPIKKLIKWMDSRIELDKKGETDKNIGRSPKYTIWSGHDTSTSTIQMFMNLVFGTKWSFPIFSSTVIFELHKNDDEKKNNVYEIRYYFNDELLLKMDYYKFIKEINEYLWSQEQIDNFCQFSIINVEKMNIIIKKYTWVIIILALILFISIFFNIRNYFKGKEKQKEN